MACQSAWQIVPFDPLQPGLNTIVAQHKEDPPLIQSLAISDYFKDLSLSVAQVLPTKFMKHIKDSHDAKDKVSEIQTLTAAVLPIADKESLIEFLKKYISKIADSQGPLVVYLGDSNVLTKDLALATHLDISDLIVTTKKGILKELIELAQQVRCKLDNIDVISESIKSRLTSYEWVKSLTSRQREIKKCLEITEKSVLGDSEIARLQKLLRVDALQLKGNMGNVSKLLRID